MKETPQILHVTEVPYIKVMPYKPDAMFEHDKSEGEVTFCGIHMLGDAPVKGAVAEAMKSFAEGWAYSQLFERIGKAQSSKLNAERWALAVKERRYGTFLISQDQLLEMPHLFAKMMAEVAVTECRCCFNIRGFEYTALSPHFKPCELGMMARRYDVIIDSKDESITWKTQD